MEIQNKMKSIHNVIDMLTGIIGDKVTVDDLKIKFKNDISQKRSRSPKEDIKKSQTNVKSSSHDKQLLINNDKDIKIERERKIQKLSEDDTKPICNFVHYDPEMHWCKVCNIFPKTAKEYLNHLHSNEHKEKCLVIIFFLFLLFKFYLCKFIKTNIVNFCIGKKNSRYAMASEKRWWN